MRAGAACAQGQRARRASDQGQRPGAARRGSEYGRRTGPTTRGSEQGLGRNWGPARERSEGLRVRGWLPNAHLRARDLGARTAGLCANCRADGLGERTGRRSCRGGLGRASKAEGLGGGGGGRGKQRRKRGRQKRGRKGKKKNNQLSPNFLVSH